jgi:hypothetical protein
MRATASPGFHPTPALARGGLAPHRGSTTVSTARLPTLSREGLPRLPRPPGPRSPDSPRSGGFVCFEAFLPPRVRARDAPLSRRHRGRCSPGLRPSRALTPIEPRTLTDPADRSVHHVASTAMTRSATPRHQVKPDDLAAATTSSASDPQGDCGPARAASRRQPCLPRPWGPGVNRRP